MTGYTKKIAVIKQIQHGFSADSGALSGVVKAETYAGFLKVEASLINFAPLSEGRYVLGISDGLKTVLFEGSNFEGESDLNLAYGFAFLVCFCNGNCQPIASAACGQLACALPDLKEEMARCESAKESPKKSESVKKQAGSAAYDDEAIAQENYYEYDLNEDGGAVRKDKTQKEDGSTGGENEEAFGAVKEQKEYVSKAYYGGNGDKNRAGTRKNGGDKAKKPDLAGGDFYGRMKGDIEKIFAAYPKEESLERAMEGSRWARISYGENKFYVFGVLCVEGVPRYICYGVPSADKENPPKSLSDFASFMPVEGGGFWIMYQDANTGVSVKISPS